MLLISTQVLFHLPLLPSLKSVSASDNNNYSSKYYYKQILNLMIFGTRNGDVQCIAAKHARILETSTNEISINQNVNELLLDQAYDSSTIITLCEPSDSKLQPIYDEISDSFEENVSPHKAGSSDREQYSDDDRDENISTNSSKRSSDDTNLVKSSKKHASSELKFQSFKINWNKISDNILDKLQKLQEFKDSAVENVVPSAMVLTRLEINDLVKAVVDQLRIINTCIRADVMEGVAKQVFLKFPCLNFVDDDGFENGNGYVMLKHKLINRNCYLNRYKELHEPKKSLVEMRKHRNVRSGTLKDYWKLTSDNCCTETFSKLIRNEPELLTNEFLEASQSYVRFRLDESKPLKDILACLPVLRRRSLLYFHFERSTGVSAKSLEEYYVAKRSKIIDYSITNRKTNGLERMSSDHDIFKYLCCRLGEDFNDVIVQKEIGTKMDDLKVDCSGPVIVAVDLGNNKRMYYVIAEQVRLTEGTESVIAAVTDLLSTHYVYNFMYMKKISKFLEFVQQYFLKILPASGSKSNATLKGKKQRVVSRLIEEISHHEVK